MSVQTLNDLRTCFFLKYGISEEDYDEMFRAVKRAEHAFHAFVPTKVIRHIREAGNLLSYETISSSSKEEKSAIYHGIAFGVNVFLPCHTDSDFTLSITQVHVDNLDYSLTDPVVNYFCFPRLGVAIPLRPGDFVSFNAQEPHCVSSRCAADTDVYCMSYYVKTAVVGGNDNQRELNEKEKKCLSLCDIKIGKKVTKKRRN